MSVRRPAARCLATVVLLMAVASGSAFGQTGARSSEGARLEVMTFNVRYGLAADGDNAWLNRRDLVFEVMQGDWDFIGLQEALVFQIEEIVEALPEYSVLYRTREADPEAGEACAILYRTSRWRLDDQRSGTFWLSETPEVPASKSWDSSLPRVATWGVFRSDEVDLLVANTHFDHRGEQARLESARLLRHRISKAAAGLPFVVLGDFNAGEDSPPVAELVGAGANPWTEAWRAIHPDEERAGTFGSWTGVDDGPKIDHIFLSTGIDVLSSEIVRWSIDGRYPSDHYPVVASLVLPPGEAGGRAEAEPGAQTWTLEITDLGACRGCANSIVRALSRVDGVIEATLHESLPQIALRVRRGLLPEEEALRTAVRDVGYTAGALSTPDR